jgi:thiol-disulfide isomerase/thioredoxin
MTFQLNVQSIALLIGLGLFSLMLAFHWWIGYLARQGQGQETPDLPAPLQEKLRQHGKLLLYFYGPQCGHCRHMTPRIDALAQRFDNVAKVDVSQADPWVAGLNIRATPTTVLIAEGKIQRILLGPLSDKAIVNLLQ